MRPLLEEAVKESVSTMQQISKDTIVANETKAIVQKEEAVASEKAKQTQAIADDAQRDLNEALPALVGCLMWMLLNRKCFHTMSEWQMTCVNLGAQCHWQLSHLVQR